MNCLPVVEMEMRSVSRRRATYGLRLVFAATGCAVALLMVAMPMVSVSPANRGRVMLVILSYLSLAFCLVVGGFLTADCVSWEKREGTLGLLFLTPLTATDIVLGKLVCHGLQMFYGVCSIFPVFFFPLVAGGVTWSEVSRIVLALVAALLLAACVGLFTSVLGTESRKTIMATFSTVVLVAGLPMIYLLILHTYTKVRPSCFGVPQLSPLFTVWSCFDSSYRQRDGPALFWGSLIALLVLSAVLIISSGVFLRRVFSALGNAAASSRIKAQQSARTAVGDANPYEWAILRRGPEAYSLGILAHILIWLFLLSLLASLVTEHWETSFSVAFLTTVVIHIVTKLRFAVEASRQINADQQSGALELLLVTTLSEQSILEGHHRALQRLAIKTLYILIGLNAVLEFCVLAFQDGLHIDSFALGMFTSFFVGGMVLAVTDFSALRWMALLKGLQASNHVKAASLTFCTTMILPWIGMGLTIGFVTSFEPSQETFIAILLSWIVVCILYDFLLVRKAGAALQKGLRRLASERV